MAEDVDKLPGSLAGGLAKLAPNEEPGAGLEYAPSDPNKLVEAANTIDWATHSLVESGMTPEDLDPSFADIVGAEFRQNNVVTSVLSSHKLANAFSPEDDDSKPLTHADVIQKVEAGNLQPFFDYFKGARTENEFDAIKADLDRELEDKRIQEAAGWTGTAVGLGAAIADVPSLLPGSVSLKGVLKAPSMMRSALEVGLGGAGFAAASEAGLQASQVTRTKEQAALNVGSATLLGGVLGASVHAIIGRAGDEVINRLDETRSDAANGYPKARSAGAAAVDIYEQAAARGLDDDDRLFNAGAFTSLEKLGDIPFIGEYLRNPRLDSERSPSAVVRDIIERLSDTASITERNAGIGTKDGKNVASQDSAQALIGKYSGLFAQASKEVDDLFKTNKAAYPEGRAQFNEAVARALADGEKSADPTVVSAASILRERVFEPIRKALVDAAVFTDDPVLKNAAGYFPIVYDSEAIKAQKEDFIDFHTGWYRVDFEDQARQALIAKGIKDSDVEDALIQNFGVDKKVPKVDNDGNPVINPKTGKQVQESQTVLAGTVRDARKELHAAAESDLAHKANERDEALQAFDKGDKNPHVTTNETDELVPLFVERDRVKDERVNVTGTRDDKLKDLAAQRQDKIDAIEHEYNRKNIEETLTREQKKVARLERDAAKNKANAKADAEAKAINKEAQKELDKLDARLKKARDDVEAIYAGRAEIIRSERDAKVAEAVERGRDSVLAARGVDLPEGHANILRKYTKGGVINTEAVERESAKAAEALFNSVTGLDCYTLSHELPQASTRGYAKARSNPAYHTDLMAKKWVIRDAMEAAEKYSRTAGADAALGSIFKKTITVGKDDAGKTITEEVGDPTLSDYLKRVKDDWNDNIIANVSVPKKVQDKLAKKYKGKELEEKLGNALKDARNKLEKQRNRDLANIETLLAFARGTSLSQSPKALHQAAEFFGILNFVTKMGGTVLTSLGDPINIALSQGFGNAAKYGIVPILKDFRKAYSESNGELRRLSRLAGANMEMEHGSRIAAMGDLGSVYASRDAMATPRKIAEKFGKLSGITYWNSFVKQISYNTSQARLITNAVEGFEKLSPSERAWMASLGVDEGRAAQFAKHYAEQSEKTVASIPIAKWDEWTDKAAGEAFRQAVYRESFNNVISPTLSDRLAFSASPTGRMVLQFRNFMIANQMRLVGRNIQLASLDKQKAANVYTGLFGLVLASAMIDAVKRIVANTSVTGESLHEESEWQRYLNDWETKPAQQLYNALDRSGHFGVLFEGSNIADKLGLPSIQGAARLATGEQSAGGTSRTKNVSVLGSAFGPTVGLLDDLAGIGKIGTSFAASKINHFAGTDSDFDTPYSFTRGDWNRIQRQAPGSTIFWLRPLINEMKIRAGNNFDWPSQD